MIKIFQYSEILQALNSCSKKCYKCLIRLISWINNITSYKFHNYNSFIYKYLYINIYRYTMTFIFYWYKIMTPPPSVVSLRNKPIMLCVGRLAAEVWMRPVCMSYCYLPGGIGNNNRVKNKIQTLHKCTRHP